MLIIVSSSSSMIRTCRIIIHSMRRITIIVLVTQLLMDKIARCDNKEN